MRVLIIDTALGLCTAGVFEVDGGEAVALGLCSEPMFKGHSERLAGFARDAVAATGRGFDRIDRIGVTVGPGSFTGLRVGMAFAQGLGAALDRPVVGLSTLDALTADAGEAHAVAALIDARRGQVYARFWIDGRPTAPAAALSLEQGAEQVRALGPAPLLIGTGAPLLGHAAPNATLRVMEGPAPGALARLTMMADPASAPARPLYLRAPDATPPTRLPGQARGSAVGG